MGDPREHKAARVRSPAYPAFDLNTAIDRARTIYQHEKRAAVPVAVVTKHCGLDIKSSGALRLIAALKHFALVTEQGGGEGRKIQLSELALDILLAPSDNDPKRIAAIKRAALSPKIHKKLWDHYHGELPSDANIGSYLVRELEFNDAQVDRFIKEFRSTIAYAQLVPSDTMTPEDGATDDAGEDESEIQPSQEQPMRRRPVQAQSGFQQATFPLNGGDAVVQWPENLNADEFEDFKDWLELVMRKVKRSVPKNHPTSADEADEEDESEGS
jgi:hypothetical protein